MPGILFGTRKIVNTFSEIDRVWRSFSLAKHRMAGESAVFIDIVSTFGQPGCDALFL